MLIHSLAVIITVRLICCDLSLLGCSWLSTSVSSNSQDLTDCTKLNAVYLFSSKSFLSVLQMKNEPLVHLKDSADSSFSRFPFLILTLKNCDTAAFYLPCKAAKQKHVLTWITRSFFFLHRDRALQPKTLHRNESPPTRVTLLRPCVSQHIEKHRARLTFQTH